LSPVTAEDNRLATKPTNSKGAALNTDNNDTVDNKDNYGAANNKDKNYTTDNKGGRNGSAETPSSQGRKQKPTKAEKLAAKEERRKRKSERNREKNRRARDKRRGKNGPRSRADSQSGEPKGRHHWRKSPGYESKEKGRKEKQSSGPKKHDRQSSNAKCEDAGDFRRRLLATPSFKGMVSVFQDRLQEAHAGEAKGARALAKKYREFSLLFHPDKCHHGEREKTTEAFKALNQAYSMEKRWAH